MLIDNFINVCRDTGCAYAIDGKQGGRLLSPLQDRAGVAWWSPLPQASGGATFEIKQGYINSEAVTNTNGMFTAGYGNGNYIKSPILLAGYAGSLTIMWEGDSSANGYPYQCGIGLSMQDIYIQLSGTNVVFNVGNGTSAVRIISPTNQAGAVKFVTVWDMQNRKAQLYNNGELLGEQAIPIDFGSINPAINVNLQAQCQNGLSRFAFWDRALSPEEAAAL